MIFTFIAFIGGFIQDVITPIKEIIKPIELKTYIYDNPNLLWEGYKVKIRYPKYFGEDIEFKVKEFNDGNYLMSNISFNVEPWGEIEIDAYYLENRGGKDDKDKDQKNAIKVMTSIYNSKKLNKENREIIENLEGYDEYLRAFGWQYWDDAIYRISPKYIESIDGYLRGVYYFTDSRYADRTLEIRVYNPDVKALISIKMPIENTGMFRNFHNELRELRDNIKKYSYEEYDRLYNKMEKDFLKKLNNEELWDEEFQKIVQDGKILAKNIVLIRN